jgi:hypothetical protein
MDNLEDLYKHYNFPGKRKLYELAKKHGVKATLKAVDEFLNNQKVAQVFTKKKQRKKPQRKGTPQHNVIRWILLRLHTD